MPGPQNEPQKSMFDRVIDDATLEEACDTYLQMKQKAKGFGKSKKKLYELVNGLELKNGERVRIGRFVITGRERRGGGIEVPTWTKTGIGSVTALD